MDAVNVLQVIVGGKDWNGVASFLYQYYKHMDHEKVHFDFLFVRENAMLSRKDDPVFVGSSMFVLNAVKKNKKTNHFTMMKGFHKVLKEHCYDVVHINTLSVGANVLLIDICKRCGIKTIISHSHNEYDPNISKIKYLAHKLFMPYINRNADYLFACSTKAGECLFGRKGIESNKFQCIINAIDPMAFNYSLKIRAEARLINDAADDTFVIGQIGRLAKQKNQSFSIEVFDDFHKDYPNSVFWIVGSGPDEQKLVEKVNSLGLNNAVRFLGQRNDINNMLNAMDVLLFPSLWEGLGIAVIEAQATGINVLASNAIPKEASITDVLHFLPINEGTDRWKNKLIMLFENNINEHRTDKYEQVKEAGFTINEAAKKLQDFYCTCANND